jgi:hypothetical protein
MMVSMKDFRFMATDKLSRAEAIDIISALYDPDLDVLGAALCQRCGGNPCDWRASGDITLISMARFIVQLERELAEQHGVTDRFIVEEDDTHAPD